MNSYTVCGLLLVASLVWYAYTRSSSASEEPTSSTASLEVLESHTLGSGWQSTVIRIVRIDDRRYAIVNGVEWGDVVPLAAVAPSPVTPPNKRYRLAEKKPSGK